MVPTNMRTGQAPTIACLYGCDARAHTHPHGVLSTPVAPNQPQRLRRACRTSVCHVCSLRTQSLNWTFRLGPAPLVSDPGAACDSVQRVQPKIEPRG